MATTTGADVYIGESQDLRHRKVRNDASAHTGRTTVQTRETLLRRLAEGRDIRLAIVIKAALGIDGEWVTADLGVKDTRRLIESAALALARRAGDQIQNLEPRSTEAAGTDEEARLRKIRADNQAAC